MRRVRGLVMAGTLAALLVALAACDPVVSTPGDTGRIELVSSATVDGWRYDFFRNPAYPCSISGYQTFTIGTKVGSSDAEARPLWTFLHGGGTGFFDPSGTPRPDSRQMTEEQPESQRRSLSADSLFERLRRSDAGFRLLAVSYCNRDLYSGALQVDPNNPNPGPNGKPKRTNGLLATKAAIQFAEAKYPTAQLFIHGGSAGSAGSYDVAWSLQQQGLAPAGVVADASVVNLEAGSAAYEQGVCRNGGYSPQAVPIFSQRVHPDFADIDNEPDKLVVRGELTVPILHMWNPGDGQTCGSKPMACPLRDGTTVTMGATDCNHRPMELAIASHSLGNRSKNLRLCVDDASKAGTCDKHVVTTGSGLTNTDPSSPADYLATVMRWVRARLADA